MKNEVRQLKECVKKLKGELAISKNISELLSDRLVNMERQCWANAQCCRRECVEVAGIPQSVPANDLEKTFSKPFEEVGIKVPAKDIDACLPVGKPRRVIVKCLRRKDCQQVFSVKKDIQKTTATNLDLPNTITKLYLNESLCPITVSYVLKVKHYLQWVKFIVISFQIDQLKYVYKKRDHQFQLHIQLILKSIFLV